TASCWASRRSTCGSRWCTRCSHAAATRIWSWWTRWTPSPRVSCSACGRPRRAGRISLELSGGKKTLSSLSLVFTLHTHKPNPLYVMDEVDAALGHVLGHSLPSTNTRLNLRRRSIIGDFRLARFGRRESLHM
ncbi:hypothetical protein Agub_g14318, partial [Astrephomene gubernaculifera]